MKKPEAKRAKKIESYGCFQQYTKLPQTIPKAQDQRSLLTDFGLVRWNVHVHRNECPLGLATLYGLMDEVTYRYVTGPVDFKIP